MQLTPAEQRQLLETAYPERLKQAEDNICYLAEMTASFLRGRWTTRKDVSSWAEYAKLVVGDEDGIPADMYGYNQARLTALNILKFSRPERFAQEVEKAAATWLWAQVEPTMCEDAVPLPELGFGAF